MDAGELDRRITLQRLTETDDGYGTVADSWADLATVWAKLMPVLGAEKLAAQEVGGTARRKFKIRRSSAVTDLTAKDRVVYSGVNHDIWDVSEMGRDFLIIDAMVRNDS